MWFYKEYDLDNYTEKDKELSDVALAYMWSFRF